MLLKKVKIHKYKSFETSQEFNIEKDITILVGMNESGKTAALEAIAKTNYFQEDEDFKFNSTHDYPRREKKLFDKSGNNPEAVTCTYEITHDLVQKIESDIGKDVIDFSEFSITTKYSDQNTWEGVKINKNIFVETKTEELGISSSSLNEKMEKVNNLKELIGLQGDFADEKYIDGLESLKVYFENEWKWTQDAICEYIARVHLKPNLPKFLYYDEYYLLPTRISIEKLKAKKLIGNEYKTAGALFELADINIDEILNSMEFEDFIAELEATQAIISDELFKYWKTNKNLSITFVVDKKVSKPVNQNARIIEHVLDIRVKNKGVSLPLKNRSKGFNWFFSFLVWFKRIQEDSNSNYILLLDEPGLNLHASAQADLLDFIKDLAEDYQIIYTTHSPFMIPTDGLERVRTILETDNGSKISDSIQEKDPKTLFPLQAALGYDIAQNLFISKKNLLVEGVSDLIFLTALSGLLEELGRVGLRSDITIVPTGGLDKVATFISLMRGSKLETVCLLDSYSNANGKAKLERMVNEKIIKKNKIRFFDEFLDSYKKADLEDLISKEEYLELFNSAFSEYPDIQITELNSDIQQILIQINKYLDIERFNHYRPANELSKKGVDKNFFCEGTLDNFENIFKLINKLFE